MTTFLISGSRGTDDPTMATLPFMAAKTARSRDMMSLCGYGMRLSRWAVKVQPTMFAV